MAEKKKKSTGWAFPISTDVYGGIKLSSDEKNIEESIKIIIETSLGEMITNKNFGSRLSSLMFAPSTPTTVSLAEDYVAGALRRWEPRIDLKDVRGEKDPDNPTAIKLVIEYDIPYLKGHDSTSYDFKTEGVNR